MLSIVILLLLLGTFTLCYMLVRAQWDHVRVHHISDNFFPSSSPLTIFFISDIHNRVIKKGTIEKIQDVDLVLIGGDLVDKRTSIEQLEQNIRRLKELDAPTFFVPGNNDHELQGENLISLLNAYEVVTLSNEDRTVPHYGGNSFLISGLDPYFLRPRRTMASAIEETDRYQILCVHDPFVFERMNKEDRQKFHLILSGHTHGGQIRFFGMGPYKRGGLRNIGSQHLLISEGYGTSVWPLRLGTSAECHIIQVSRTNVV